MSATPTGLVEILPQLASEALHREAWAVCCGNRWYFGNRSNHQHSTPFWKMDLDGDPVFDAIWKAARPRCEQLAGRKLRVVRQYANGHTYGLGGDPHRDDERPGCFTLLYYPMPEWKPEWQGETVYYGADGEIARSVTPRPNFAVFFEAGIPHAGRAPSRSCMELRVTVAYKLEPAEGRMESPVAAPVLMPGSLPFSVAEVQRSGPQRVYRVAADSGAVAERVADRLKEVGQSLRIPGYRPGKIPVEILKSRYGARTRSEVISSIGGRAIEQVLATGGLPVSLQIIGGMESGDVEVRLTVTHLPDLPDADFGQCEVERLTLSDGVLGESGVSAADAAQFLAQELQVQVLDHVQRVFDFPVAAPLVEREMESIRKTAGIQPEAGEALAELREIAERRVRLGAVLVELARRHKVAAGNDPALEARVIAWLLSRMRVVDRPATAEELRALAE